MQVMLSNYHTHKFAYNQMDTKSGTGCCVHRSGATYQNHKLYFFSLPPSEAGAPLAGAFVLPLLNSPAFTKTNLE